jgi:hypothetical protein
MLRRAGVCTGPMEIPDRPYQPDPDFHSYSRRILRLGRNPASASPAGKPHRSEVGGSVASDRRGGMVRPVVSDALLNGQHIKKVLRVRSGEQEIMMVEDVLESKPA